MNVVEYINYVVFLVGDIYKLRCLIRFKVFTIIYLLYTFFFNATKDSGYTKQYYKLPICFY